MSCFPINGSCIRFPVLKDGVQLFNTTDEAQIILHSGLIVFVRDKYSESVVITPKTDMHCAPALSWIGITAEVNGAAYEIKAPDQPTVKELFNQIQAAAGQDALVKEEEVVVEVKEEKVEEVEEDTARKAIEDKAGDSENSEQGTPREWIRLPPTSGQSERYWDGTYVRLGPRGKHVNVTEASASGSSGPSSSDDPAEKKCKFEDDFGRKVFVGNLPRNITTQKLRDIFSVYGGIDEITIIPNKKEYTPYIAFVRFELESSAQAALENRRSIHIMMRDGTPRRLNVHEVLPNPTGILPLLRTIPSKKEMRAELQRLAMEGNEPPPQLLPGGREDGKYNFHCSKCGKFYTRRGTHFLCIGSIDFTLPETVACHLCGKLFQETRDLEVHIGDVHKLRQKDRLALGLI